MILNKTPCKSRRVEREKLPDGIIRLLFRSVEWGLEEKESIEEPLSGFRRRGDECCEVGRSAPFLAAAAERDGNCNAAVEKTANVGSNHENFGGSHRSGHGGSVERVGQADRCIPEECAAGGARASFEFHHWTERCDNRDHVERKDGRGGCGTGPGVVPE